MAEFTSPVCRLYSQALGSMNRVIFAGPMRMIRRLEKPILSFADGGGLPASLRCGSFHAKRIEQ